MAGLPDDIAALFDGANLEEKFGLAYELVTVDGTGRPRVAMLSHGEILAVDGELRLALWPGSTTSANLADGRPYLLSVVQPGSVQYLLGTAERLPGDAPLACFSLTVDEVREDQHAGYPVKAPITYEGRRSLDETLSDWRTQHDMLRT